MTIDIAALQSEKAGREPKPTKAKAKQHLLESAASFIQRIGDQIESRVPPQIAPQQPGSPGKAKRKKKRKPKNKKRADARRKGKARRLAARHRFFHDLRKLPDDACLTLAEWYTLNGLSERQGRRILNDPEKRPKITMLSPLRKGVTVRANREWQESRSR
jgi:hypothetical protein